MGLLPRQTPFDFQKMVAEQQLNLHFNRPWGGSAVGSRG
jgi:hypothetical protein